MYPKTTEICDLKVYNYGKKILQNKIVIKKFSFSFTKLDRWRGKRSKIF